MCVAVGTVAGPPRRCDACVSRHAWRSGLRTLPARRLLRCPVRYRPANSAASTDGAAGGSAVSRSPHWPALDGWRGFTIWFAISVHAGYFTAGGVLSLDTFFVLSGFLITGLLLREWQRGEHIDLLRFWARRARRLLPALFVVLTAVVIYAAFLAPTLGVATVRGDLLTSVFYVVNWHFIFSGQSYFSAFTTPSPVLHLWSLAVEEQFYFVWPLLVLATLWAARRRVGRTGAITAVGVVALVGAIASSVWMVHLYVPGGDPSRVYYGTDTRAQAMLLGAALAVFVLVHGPLRSRAGRVALQLAAPLCLVVVIAPWFASDATAVHDVFYGQFGLFALLHRDVGRAVAPGAAVGRPAGSGPEPVTGSVGRRNLLRDVPVALAHVPGPHIGPHRSRRVLAARCSPRGGGRPRVAHTHVRRGADPTWRYAAFAAPG